MSQKKVGNLTAYLKPPGKQGYSQKIGNVYEKDNGDLSLKIDVLPIAGAPWDGWCNIWRDDRPRSTAAPTEPVQKIAGFDDLEDDIPF